MAELAALGTLPAVDFLTLQGQAGRFPWQLLQGDTCLSVNPGLSGKFTSHVIIMGTAETPFPSALDAKYFPSSIFGYVGFVQVYLNRKAQ